MAELNPLELRDYIRSQGEKTAEADGLADSNRIEWDEQEYQLTVGDLSLELYVFDSNVLGGQRVTVKQGATELYVSQFGDYAQRPNVPDVEYRIDVNTLSESQVATLQAALQQVSPVVEAQVVPETAPQVQVFGSLLDSYVANYGEQAPVVAAVRALAQRGELFDRTQDDTSIVEAYFHRVPDSTLIVNRVDTNDEYGDSRTFTVLDGDEPLFVIGDSGQIKLNNLTPGQVETLQAAQRDGASPLLVSEMFFQSDVAQAFTPEGEAQARSILSQGDSTTPNMVTALNDLLTLEEDIRRQEQASRGFFGDVAYPRFTEQELNQRLSLDTIARQLSAQSPLLEVQAVQQPNVQVNNPIDLAAMPNVYDRPRSETQRMETLALTLLQSGETLIAPATVSADGMPLLPPMQLTLSDQVGSDGMRLIERFYPDTDYSPGQRSLHTPVVLRDGVIQAMHDGTLTTAAGQSVTLTDIDQSRPPAVAQEPLGAGYESDSTHTTQQEQEGSVMATRTKKSKQAAVQEAATPEVVPTVVEPTVVEAVVAETVEQAPEPAAVSTPEAEAPAPAVEAPAAPELETSTEINLRDLMSVKALAILDTGKVPQQRAEVDGKPQLVDRSLEVGLAMVARAAYGAENFCKENGLPHVEASPLVASAAETLGLNGRDAAAVLESIDRDKCRPGIEAATKSQSAVWARIEEKYPEYADRVPEAIKAERSAVPVAAVESVVAAREVIADVTKRQVPAPVLKQEAKVPPTQFEMAVTVAAYNLQKEGVDRMGHDNPKAKVIANRSADGNISVIDKASNTLIASRNGVTGQVIPGTLPAGQDYTQAYKAVVDMQTKKYEAKTAATAPKSKVASGR